MHLRWLQLLWVVALSCYVCPVRASLTEMDMAAWNAHLKSKSPSELLIFLYADGSKECEHAEQVIEGMIQDGEINQVLPGIKVMRQTKDGPLARGIGINTFPSLVLLRDGITAFYTGRMDESSEVFMWLDKAGMKSVTKELMDDTFEHLTQAATGSTTGYWLVLFYRDECLNHFPILETVGINEKLTTNVARVNLDKNPKLEKRFKVTSCPELIYFREGKMYRYEMKKYDVSAVTSFITMWFRNVKASPVPLDPTAFDDLTEGIARYIKTQLEGENRTFTLVIIAGFAVTIVLTSVFCCLTGGSDSKQKKE